MAKGDRWIAADGKIFASAKKAHIHEKMITRQFIQEEMDTGKYLPKQAVAIGLSRARSLGIRIPRRK